MKRIVAALMTLILAASMTAAAYAESIGVVDYQKLIASYRKAQAFSDDSKIKENELEKMRAEFIKQIRETKDKNPDNPIAVEQLEKDLQNRLTAKLNETRDWAMSKQQELETQMKTAIEGVAKGKSLDMIVAKQYVFYGGADITNEVISALNKP